MSQPFREVVSRHQWWWQDKNRVEGEEQQQTHLLLNSGILSVRGDALAQFHSVYANAIVHNEALYVVSKRTFPIYRMFFDIDTIVYEAPEDLNDFYEKVSKMVAATVFELFSDALAAAAADSSLGRLIVSVAEPVPFKKKSKDCVKIGMHINAPNIHVNKEMALRLRMATAQKLENNIEKNGPTTWDEDVDHAVYEGSGLRMTFSRKGKRCRCTGARRLTCELCHGAGFIDEGRAYLPLLEIHAGDQPSCFVPVYRDEWSQFYESVRPVTPRARLSAADAGGHNQFETILSLLNDTCIRSTAQTPNVEFNAKPPSWFEDPFDNQVVEIDGTTVQLGPGAPAAKRRRLDEGREAVEGGLQDKVKLASSDEVAINNWLEVQVRRHVFPKEYKTARIDSAFSFSTNSIRSHVICRLQSQYCMNIGRAHATNTVYLELNLVTQKAFMKCYCRCDTLEGRRPDAKGKKVLCKDYRSQPVDIKNLQLSIQCTNNRPKMLSIL